ncbi:hypothetical protein [Pectobacterium parvum]|uniref:hypothetical protein n=1 Tax=Pectobacterium parvum TaxID=2778550 RepID=UPI00382055A5
MYKKYLKNRKEMSLIYNGYDLSNIMSFDIACLSYGQKKSFRKHLTNIFFAQKISIPLFNDDILFSMGPYGKRVDYNEIIHHAMSEVDIKNIFKVEEKPKLEFLFSLKGFKFTILEFFKRKIDLPIKSKLILFLTMLHYINTIELLQKESISWKYKKYCSFCSSLPLEAIIDNYFRLHNVTTYTLQHAIYSFPNTPQIDIVTLDNMPSDYILCWGKYTKDEFLRYGNIPPAKIKISGYPHPIKNLSPYEIKGRCRILFLCSRKIYSDENIKIIRIISSCLNEIDIDVTIKPHPGLDIEEYRKISDSFGLKFYESSSVSDALNSKKFDIVITYNSTAYYDAYMNNIIALKYKNDRNEMNFNIMENDSFSSKAELLAQLKIIIEESNNENTWINIKNKLHYATGYGINNYSDSLASSAPS